MTKYTKVLLIIAAVLFAIAMFTGSLVYQVDYATMKPIRVESWMIVAEIFLVLTIMSLLGAILTEGFKSKIKQ